MNDYNKDWTVGRSIVLLLLLLDLTVVAVWLFFYYDHYETISTVVGGLWAAVLAVLAAVRIRSEGATSLSTFVGLTPVKLIAGTYTAIIVILLLVFALFEFPVHRIDVDSPSLDDFTPTCIALLSGSDTIARHMNGPSARFRVRRGSYTLLYEPEGYESSLRTVDVPTLSLRQHVSFERFELLYGYLQVTVSHDLILTIHDSGGQPVDEIPVTEGAVALQSLAPGHYLVQAAPPGRQPNTYELDIAPAATTRLRVTFPPIILPPPPVATIAIHNPIEMEVLVNGAPVGMLTPTELQLSPGNYRIELRKRQSERFGYQLQRFITISEGEQVVIDESLPDLIELPELVVWPRDPGFTYWLDKVDDSTLLGRLYGPNVRVVFLGQHRLIKQLGDTIEHSARFIIRRDTTVLF